MLEQSLSDVDSAAAAPVTDDDLEGVNKAGRENTVDSVGPKSPRRLCTENIRLGRHYSGVMGIKGVAGASWT